MVNDTIVGYSERYAQRNKQKLHNFYRPASAILNIQCALQAAGPRLLMLGRVFHSSEQDFQSDV